MNKGKQKGGRRKDESSDASKGKTVIRKLSYTRFPVGKDSDDPWKVDSLKVPDRIQYFQFFCQQGTSHFAVCNFSPLVVLLTFHKASTQNPPGISVLTEWAISKARQSAFTSANFPK